MREIWNKLTAMFHKSRLDSELSEELAIHVELATEEFIQQGMSPAEARRKAMVNLGGLEQSKEAHRDARGLPAFDALLQDLRYSLRSLRRDAGFALFSILIIGLGIGASATVFSLVNSLLVRPLPFNDPQSLVWIANKTKTEDSMSGRTVQVAPAVALRDRNKSFEDIAAYFAFYGAGEVKMTGVGEPERLTAVPVSEKFFPLLGVTPMLGRQFSAAECVWRGPKVTMLSHNFWTRRFNSDPQIVGKGLRLDGDLWTVIGVMPASFDFGAIFAPGMQIDLFFPFPLTKETDRWGNTLSLVGRLKPDSTMQRAQAEADTLSVQINSENPNRNPIKPTMALLSDQVSGQIRPALVILSFAVGVVMLIVCANLSNLMLARTAARQKEMAIRAALGAGRNRLIRQLLTESLLLTGCGAMLGILLAFIATRAISLLTAFKLPLLSTVHIDKTVLGFTVMVALFTGLVLGLAPSWQLSALRLNASLVQKGAGASQSQAWVRGTLVVSEIAFACVLLVGASLLLRSFLQVLDVQLGFNPQTAMAMRLEAGPNYTTPPARLAWLNDALGRVRNVAGVEAAAMVDSLPLGKNRTWGAGVKGRTYASGQYPSSFVRLITEDYVKAMGMSVKQGRDFTAFDTPDGAQVMLINETLARNNWPGENPIGKVIVGPCAKEREVVGVVNDVRHMALEKDSGNEMYIPMRQCNDSQARGELVVRSATSLGILSPVIEASLRPIAPDLPKGGLYPLTKLVDRALSPRRFLVLLLTSFASFALLLASLGIYGLISYSVHRRTQEIGIRMALGATAFDVQQRIVVRTLGLALLGIVTGAMAASALSGWMQSLLYGVKPGDPLTFAAAACLLIAIAGLAGYIPARRASKIDPMICLRAE